MNRGRIEQVAHPEVVYDKPATTFVAGFIGVSNLMPGVVKRSGASGEVELDSGVTVTPTSTGSPSASAATRWSDPEKRRSPARTSRPTGGPERRGTGRELALSRHLDPDDRPASKWRGAVDRAQPEHRRGGAAQAARRRGEGQALMGA